MISAAQREADAMEPTTHQPALDQQAVALPNWPDWVRLQKALSVESERGFNNIEGHQQLFSEFVASSLLNGLKALSANLAGQLKDGDKWKTLAERFDQYSELSFSQRQHLVADTRRFLHRARQTADALPLFAKSRVAESRAAESGGSYQGEATAAGASKTGQTGKTTKRKTKSPKTTDVTGLSDRSDSNHPLDRPLTYLKGVGPNKAEKLAKLGLLSIRDVLFYYPRDYIDYARQVKIKDLVPGETVTLVATAHAILSSRCLT
jgi:ATP-dependent DNA helicase RecG